MKFPQLPQPPKPKFEPWLREYVVLFIEDSADTRDRLDAARLANSIILKCILRRP